MATPGGCIPKCSGTTAVPPESIFTVMHMQLFFYFSFFIKKD